MITFFLAMAFCDWCWAFRSFGKGEYARAACSMAEAALFVSIAIFLKLP